MAILRLWPATNGPAAVVVDTDNYTMGTEFKVSASGCTATAIYFWRPANAPLTSFSVGIYQVAAGGASGTLLGSVTGQSAPANYNGWYRVQLTTPISLTSGTSYIACVNSSTDNFYAATSNYWSGAGAGASGITNGVLTAPQHGQTIGTTQARFVSSTTLTYPNTGFNFSNYWIDVEVNDGVSSGVTGTLSASPPVLTASISGASLTTGTLSATTPKLTASLPGVVNDPVTGTLAATLPKPTSSIPGTNVVTGTLAATLPKATSSIPGVLVSTGSISAAVPKVAASISDVVTPTVAQENANSTGVNGPAFWKDGLTSEAIPGFARSTYYLPGETAEFSINYSSAYTVGVWRLGHYGGSGGRNVATFAGTTASQPAAVTIPNSNGAVTCAAWSRNVTWAVPANATPGWYELVLTGANATDYGHILFCVSDGLAKKSTLIVSSDATWHCAYNGYGGNNVYGASKGIGTISARALCSTYDKPVITRDYVPQTYFFNATLPYLKWSESLGINAGYTTIEQINNDPTILDGRDVVVFTGHNEYIPQRVMDKTKALLAAGSTNIVNIAGNDFFWRVAMGGTTFPTGATGTSTGRVMWCKKDTISGPTTPTNFSHTGGTAFTSQADWTGSWQDTRWSNREPSATLFGDQFIANGIRADQVKVPFAMKGSPAWRNCSGIQALTSGQTYSFAAGTLGMEWDKPVSGGPVQTSFSASTVTLTNGASDANGENYDVTDTATHGFTMGRSAGGSHIANFNSDQWPWALDALHDRGSTAADANAKQMMLNVLYDLGTTATPASVSTAGLTLPTPVTSIDTDYGLPETVTGLVTASLPMVTGSLPGAVLTIGSVNGQVPRLTSSITGASLTLGTLGASLPLLSAALTGQSFAPVTGTLGASLPVLSGSFAGVSFTPVTGTLGVSIPLLSAALTGQSFAPVTGVLDAPLPLASGSLVGAQVTIGTLSASTPKVRALIRSATGSITPRVLSVRLRDGSRYLVVLREEQ